MGLDFSLLVLFVRVLFLVWFVFLLFSCSGSLFLVLRLLFSSLFSCLNGPVPKAFAFTMGGLGFKSSPGAGIAQSVVCWARCPA